MQLLWAIRQEIEGVIPRNDTVSPFLKLLSFRKEGTATLCIRESAMGQAVSLWIPQIQNWKLYAFKWTGTLKYITPEPISVFSISGHAIRNDFCRQLLRPSNGWNLIIRQLSVFTTDSGPNLSMRSPKLVTVTCRTPLITSPHSTFGMKVGGLALLSICPESSPVVLALKGIVLWSMSASETPEKMLTFVF